MRKTQKKNFYLLSMLVALLGLSQFSYVHAQNEVKKSISLQNVSVNELVKKLGVVYPHSFFITDKDAAEVIVSVEAKNATVEQVLTQAFRGKGLAFTKKDLNIVITFSPKTGTQTETKKSISGTVIDENGDPLTGATVIEKGTRNGIVTDERGAFSLNVGEKAVLQISYIGYVTKEIKASSIGNKSFEITLLDDVQSLEEVVAVGYGKTTAILPSLMRQGYSL
ncbi:MAG: carboxypeptidase-like regulatory domain-containing protein [Dysgonamonadaceae bacterium]|jgi:hypothetical protein|nr:carboxypeptidase-like regulatory domain-containing protein [Dysgonamonadaceae bacterium]